MSANGHRPRTVDWTEPLAYTPAEGTRMLTCAVVRCGAKYLDDDRGRAAP